MSAICSCKKEKPKTPANFVITNETWGIKSYGSVYVSVTVKNTGELTGYNVAVDYQLKNGNTIIDTGTAHPANLGDIQGGISATDEAVFFNTTSTAGMTYTYKTTWLNR